MIDAIPIGNPAEALAFPRLASLSSPTVSSEVVGLFRFIRQPTSPASQ